MSTRIVLGLVVVLVALSRPMLYAGEAPGPQWTQVAEGRTGQRTGSVLLFASDLSRMLLVGLAKGAPLIQQFDPDSRTWSELSSAPAPAKEFYPYYQAAYDPGSQTVFCLSGSNVVYGFRLAERKWKTLAPAAELDGLSWHALACDPESRRLVVVGADKIPGNLGWSRTVVYDIPAGQWTRLEVADAKVLEIHRQLVALAEQTVDLIGRIRMAWFRDPNGIGTDGELRELSNRCEAWGKLPQAGEFAADVQAVQAMLGEQKTLDALKAARRLKRKIDEAADAQYPVPSARRNSPLAFDAKHKVFVLFGGDHEDYLMNDTWVLDLGRAPGAQAAGWKRMSPPMAPSPRAGHAMFSLPAQGGVAMYEGYVQSTSTDYGAPPYRPINPIELWRYDLPTDRWEVLGHWPHPGKKQTDGVPPVGHFDGYASQYFSPPAIAADRQDRIVLAADPGRVWYSAWKDFPSRTWTLEARSAQPDDAARTKLGKPANSRQERGGMFAADFGEVPAPPPDTGLDRLPENRWVRLPSPPRNPCSGCRQRDWGTAVWDADREQILLWGGGHCVRAASSVAHYSPASGRLVEGFDADEPYGANGGGGFDSSVLNRPWVSTHNYNHYAYDPKCRLMVSARGYLYNPDRMDWLRIRPIPAPFEFQWGSTVVETSPHGAVAWARKHHSEAAGLWLFDREQGWIDLKPQGTLFVPYCDSHGMVYDSRRDRMLFSSVGGSYQKVSNGTFLAFDFRTRQLSTITPQNADLAKTRNARELAYVEHADWILLGDMLGKGDEKIGKLYTRVYDCEKNAMFLLDAGNIGERNDPGWVTYSTGWMYDARRKLAYVFSVRGEAWAMKINSRTAQRIER